MDQVLTALEWPVVLDILALAASLALIGGLIYNRIRYGHLVLPPRDATGSFSSAMTCQMVVQQSQRSYHKIQQTLQQEFERLQHLAGGDQHVGPQGDMTEETTGHRPDATPMSLQRSQCYSQALSMIQKGAEPQAVAQRCGLALSEINLLDYIQKTRH